MNCMNCDLFIYLFIYSSWVLSTNAVQLYQYTKENIGPLKDDNGNVLTDVESMGELLNRFFCVSILKGTRWWR